MHCYQLFGPDTAFGRALMRLRTEAELLEMRLSRSVPWDPEFARLARRLVPAHSMVSGQRLRKLYDLGIETGANSAEGAAVECGVWNGGSSAIVAAGMLRGGSSRPFWLFDSFQGLPEPTENDEKKVREGYFPGWCTGATEKVREAHQKVGHDLNMDRVIPGWFEDTLASHAEAIGPIAFLHIDADWYDSVTCVLEALYGQVESGGIVVIDDYNVWSGCRKAVCDYFGEDELETLNLQSIGGNAVWFYKP